MIEHIKYVKTLAEHLEAEGDAVKEKDLVIILISILSDEYNFFITALETIAEEKLTWDYVRDRLLHEYEKMHTGNAIARGSDVNQDAPSSSKTTHQKKIFDKRKFKCHYCKRKGHFAKDCFKRKADERKPRNQEAANRI